MVIMERVPSVASSSSNAMELVSFSGGGEDDAHLSPGSGAMIVAAAAPPRPTLPQQAVSGMAGAASNKGDFAVRDSVNKANAMRNRQKEEKLNNPLLNKTIVRRVVNSGGFDLLILVIILLNGAWIGVDLDYNPDDLENHPPDFLPAAMFLWTDYVFASIFTLEIMLRLCAYRNPLHFFTDPHTWKWNWFDFIITAIIGIETWILPALNIYNSPTETFSALRLVRLLKSTGSFSMLGELSMLVTSMMAAIRSVSSTLVLLIGLTYLFGIVFTQWNNQNPDMPADDVDFDELFGDIPRSMMTLVQMVIDTDFDVIRGCMQNSKMLGWLCILYVLLGSLTILNMLIGVICEAVAAKNEKTRQKNLTRQIEVFFGKLDNDGSGILSRSQLSLVIEDPMLKEMEITPVMVQSAFEIIDTDKNGFVDHTDFVQMITKLLAPPNTMDFAKMMRNIDILIERTSPRRTVD